jgi:hypothetical protein
MDPDADDEYVPEELPIPQQEDLPFYAESEDRQYQIGQHDSDPKSSN